MLLKGEAAVVFDPSLVGERKIRFKVGDGTSKFSKLPFLADYDAQIADIEAELDRLEAEKVDGLVEGTKGKSRIFNEADGGGSKFEANNGQNAYVGVHDNIGGEIGAQIYADKNANESTIIDVTPNGAFYTKGEVKPGAERDVEANEIAVKGDIKKVSDDLAAEVARAKAAEADLADDLAAEVVRAQTAENTKVDKDIISTAGKARIFNEADGGGAKFENVDGTASFAGVNSDTNGGIGAQLYDIDVAANKGSKLDVTKNGIYYTTGDESALPASQRDVEANEIATKGDIEAITVPEYTMVKQATPDMGMASTYYLTKDGVQVGATINIAKDQFLKNAYFCKTAEDVPEGHEIPEGLEFPAILFVFATSEEADKDTWVSVKDLVDVYTAGNGIEINNNEISVKVKEADKYIEVTADGVASKGIDEELAKKVNKEIVGTNGKAEIFNEADGGGAKFTHKDGTESFVGVNDGGENGLVAQIYADKLVNGKWQGAKLDVTNGAMYYTVGDKSFAERKAPENEIATVGKVVDVIKANIICGGDASD